MSSSVFATYCSGANHTIGLSLNCAGPECGSFLKWPPFNSTCSQADTGGNVTCANNVTCSGGSLTDKFTITKDDSKVTIRDDVTMQNGTALVVDTSSPLNITNATTTASSPSPTSSHNGCSPTKPQTFGLRGLLLLIAIASLLAPALAEQSTPTRLDTREALAIIDNRDYAALGPSPPLPLPAALLLTREDKGKVAEALSKAASDYTIALAERGTRPDAAEAVKQFVYAVQGQILPPGANIEAEFAQGRVDDAIKDSVKVFVERALTTAILAGAPETGGADLLLLLEVHVIATFIVDIAFEALKSLVAPPAATGSGTPPTNLPDVPGCNKGNYSASPTFGESNEFGTDAWRNCKQCCVNWGATLYPQFQGVCGCCTLQVQFDTLPNCCGQVYFDQCCRVSCGISN